MRVFMELDLSDEQRTQVRSLMQEAMDGELGRLLQDRREQRRAVGRLIHDPAAEESAVLDAVRAAAAEAEQLALEQHRLTVALFGVLDETQRAQAAELLEELPDRLQGWGRGRRGQRRGPAAAPTPTPAPTPAG
jgi:Spy/CpxP family protein refolding chaperone